MPGGLRPPPEEDEQAARLAEKGGIYFILEQADLEVGKVGKEYRLLNSDEHATYLQRKGEDASLYRPDICHQALLAILDSPLNKAGKVKLFVRSKKNVLIEVHPQVRLPRTFRRFCGLMAQLLQKLSIRSTNSKERMLKVVKGPVTRYLPSDALRISFSQHAHETVDMFKFVQTECPRDKPLVLIIGAFSHGQIDASYTDREVSISSYPLSAAQALSRITNALEQKEGII